MFECNSVDGLLIGSIALFVGILAGCGDLGESHAWEQIRSPAENVDHIKAIHFYDDQRGWLAAEGATGVDDQGAWYTDDGGETWDLRKGEYSAMTARFDATGERTWLSGRDSRGIWYADDEEDFKPIDGELEVPDTGEVIYFWDKNTGILGSNTGHRIHRTTDGGDSFTVEKFGQDTAPGMNDLTVAGDKAWVGTGGEFSEDGKGGPILHSDDRGQNWSVNYLEDKAHDYAGGAIMGVYAASETEVWAVGVNRQLYYTTDGESWEQVKGIPEKARRFEAIDGLGDHIIAAGNNDQGPFVFESTDGGDNWTFTELRPRCSSKDCRIEGLEFVSSDLVYAYGPYNTIMRYEP